jgi:hypothetical protein
MSVLTRRSTYGATAAQMVNHGGIALHVPLSVEIAAKTRVCDLSILEHTYTHFDCVDSISAVFQDSHANLGRIMASGQMMSLILEAVEACASMHEDRT